MYSCTLSFDRGQGWGFFEFFSKVSKLFSAEMCLRQDVIERDANIKDLVVTGMFSGIKRFCWILGSVEYFWCEKERHGSVAPKINTLFSLLGKRHQS